ncbi:MAG: hypothetical protein ACRYFZ_02410 [Janthinobacterium lividum]
MDNNLWLYADGKQQYHAAYSLIIFGAENLKRANLIKGLDKLETNSKLIQLGLEYNRMAFVQEFMWDYLIDCIRILMFFEGYMKAEIIKGDCCVHNINHDGACLSFKQLAKEQKSRPIKLKEIANIEPFVCDASKEIVTHNCIRATTLSVNILLSSQYRVFYQFDDAIAEDIKYFNEIRNGLHFNINTEIQLGPSLVERLKRINDFVDLTIEKWKPKS